jgi:hypothetical protein
MTMNILDFTVEEQALVAIYKADTRVATFAAIKAALPDMDADFQGIATQAAAKLGAMSDDEFAAAAFTLADEDEPEPDGVA